MSDIFKQTFKNILSISGCPLQKVDWNYLVLPWLETEVPRTFVYWWIMLVILVAKHQQSGSSLN